MTASPALTPALFPAWFEALHGHAPFPWQARLAARVCAGEGWPALLDLPTGSGKTAAIDVAVFHLALEATRGEARAAPVRIAFIVDRRLVVDEAFARASRIAKALSAASDGPVRLVADALRSLAGEDQPPLVAKALRGGVPRDRDFVRSPVQPTVFCSTVDQVGSRLLFRGYGLSEYMRPIPAGLLGGDTLILLDEAHLAEPLRQTLEGVSLLRRGQHSPKAPFIVTQLSATPGDAQERFSLTEDDRAHPLLAQRLGTAKPARLLDLGKDRIGDLAKAAHALVRDLQAAGVAQPAIGVVVNRVARARALYEALGEKTGLDRHLVIGPNRQPHKEIVAQELAPFKSGAGDHGRTQPTIIVATQTIEAGVDLDLDGLVTEAAALDALRQRFGRLNRTGRPIAARAVIAAHREDLKANRDDPVYGAALRATWAQLCAWAGEAGEVDFGIDALTTQLAELASEDLVQLATERADAPVLMPAHVGLLAQTSPPPKADPEVSLYLHGRRASPEGVRIVWRCDIDPREADAAVALLTAAPPRSEEALEISLFAARAWLEQRPEDADSADAPEAEPRDLQRPGEPKLAVRWAGPESAASKAIRPSELRPGDLIVVPAAYGGVDNLGWNPARAGAAEDIGMQVPQHGQRFVRLTEGVWIANALAALDLLETANPEAAQAEAAVKARKAHRAVMAALGEGRPMEAVAKVRSSLQPGEDGGAALNLAPVAEALSALDLETLQLDRDVLDWRDDAPAAVVISGRPLHQSGTHGEEIAATEDDALGSANGSGETLDTHLTEVAKLAAAFAGKSLVAPEVAEDIELAALLHDLGKADPRFQAMLAGGSLYDVDPDLVLAKSREAIGRKAAERAGLPRSWRHEALSVSYARAHPAFTAAHDPELVLWLIGAHHGRGRPFFLFEDPAPSPLADIAPILGEPLAGEAQVGPERFAFDLDGLDWPALFGVLRARYGVWELARFEAILRLADHRASERAQKSQKVAP